MPTVIDLGELGSRGFVIQGDVAGNDAAGGSVSAAGDVNGDGFDDFIIGDYWNDSGGDAAGAAYVIFGKAEGLGSFDLTNLQPSQGFKIQGDEAGDYAGRSVSAAGDVNGDGFDDIIIGASYYGFYASTAHAYVIFGKASGFGTIDLTGLAASSGFVITNQIAAFSTFSVAGAGDVNGDGFDDVIIGSSYDNGTEGAAYVIFGKASGFGPIDLATLSATAGFEIIGDAADDQAGHSVAGAGDVNGDGFDDLIIGAPPGFYGLGSGAEAYVIFGKATLTTIDLTNLTSTDGFRIQGDSEGQWAGAAVAGAGDVNGDGFDDIIVASKYGSMGGHLGGQVFVIFGKASGFGTVDLANLGTAGFIIQGDAVGDHAGWSISAAGDVNGDGFDDLILGAPYGDNAANNAGEAYVIFGKASGFGTIDLTNLGPADGFIIEGDAANARVGMSVAGAGDIDGDGFADLLVGNPLAFNGVNDAGRVYVIFGDGIEVPNDVPNDFNGDGRSDILWRNETGAMSQWLGQAGGTFAYNANAAYSLPPNWEAAATGDFNGDGRDDIIWRNEAGAMSQWLGQSDGNFAYNPSAAYQLPTNWEVAAAGDFNGDGRDDIIWRNEAGALSEWLGQVGGTFAYNPSAAYQLPTNWGVAARGDFNGDGRDDIIWRNELGAMSEWLGQAQGTFAYNPNAAYQLSTNWEVAAKGDFNGDGRDDILWRNETGAMSQWLGQD